MKFPESLQSNPAEHRWINCTPRLARNPYTLHPDRTWSAKQDYRMQFDTH